MAPERFGGMDQGLSAVVQIGEVTCGEPEQWLPDHPVLLARARQPLAPCLLNPAEALSRECIAAAPSEKR
ncbi:hypothetical protein ACRAKI_21000 [Saccharothrix isguenensis]